MQVIRPQGQVTTDELLAYINNLHAQHGEKDLKLISNGARMVEMQARIDELEAATTVADLADIGVEAKPEDILPLGAHHHADPED